MTSHQTKSYQQGHHNAVTANHKTRTAEIEGAFVLPHLKPDFHILDVGCGPGTITTSFAKYVPQGTVTGVDLTPQAISQAQEFLSTQNPPLSNVSFKIGNLLEGLPFPDAKFDVVFCSQTLIHIHDPVSALKEMKRVCKPGGLVCAREGDMPFRFVPYLRGLQLQNKYMYYMVMGKSDKEHPDSPPFGPEHRSGSLVHVWARQAGFDPLKIVKGAKTQMYTTPEERKAYAEIMVARVEQAGHKEKYMALGATEEEIDLIISDFWKWAEDVDGWHCILHCETICRN